MNTPEFIAFLASLVPGNCQFASFEYKAKETGELARHNVLLGFNYRSTVEQSIVALEILMPTFKTDLDIEAANELLESFNKTIAGKQDGYTKSHIYQDTAIKGIKINSNDDSLQLFGLQQSKVVIIPGTYKEVKSRPLTIAKNNIRKQLPIDKFREYALDKDVIQSARLNGLVLEFN